MKHTVHICDSCASPWCEDGEAYGPCTHGPVLCEACGLECPTCAAAWAEDADEQRALDAARGK